MNRRKFLTALAPVVALAAPVHAQLEISTPGAASGKLAPGGAPAPVKPKAKPDSAPKGPTEITSAEASLDNREHIAVFSGAVDVKDPQFNLTCDKLTVHLRKPKGEGAQPRPIGAEGDPVAAPKAKEESGIDLAIAEGNVVIMQVKADANGKLQKYYGKAAKAVFDNNKKTCVLTGWPKVSQSLGESLGKQIVALQQGTIITLEQDGVIKADGPNKVTLTDVSAFDPEKK